MPYITFDENAAEALKFVIKGTSTRDEHDSLLFIEIDNSSAVISTQGTAPHRSMSVLVEDSDGEAHTFAIRAKSLESIAKKVDEGRSLSLNFKDDSRVHMSCGATSGSVVNLIDYTVDTRARRKVEEKTTTDAVYALSSLRGAIKTATNEGVISISDDGTGMAIEAGHGDIRTQEIISATLIHPDETYSVRVLGKYLRNVSDISRIDDISTMIVSVGHGIVSFSVPVDGDKSSLAEVSITVPTYISHIEPDESPCDGDQDAIFSIENSTFKGSLNALKDVVGSNSIVALEVNNNSTLTLRVSDEYSEGKTVIVEDVTTFEEGIYSVSLSSLLTALNAVPNDMIKVNSVSYREDSEWITLSAEFDESAEEESDNSDIIVAVEQI